MSLKISYPAFVVILLGGLFLHPRQSFAQVRKQTPAAILPLDKAVRTGKLPNGFTYFIRHNEEPKNRVVFYLVNKVGSVLETDEQQGLAHFMEHMSFNGTKHYPKNELVNYLQKAGIRFGADLNAYTSYDQTVYQLPLPADDTVLINNGLQILRDWAQDALLDPQEINQERGVVLEEKRLSKGASERMQQKTFPVLVNHSHYADRSPIGLDTVLNNFKPETLIKFYHDWYRPDLQALIVVGDIDVTKMEQMIKAKFADLKNPENEKQRPDYTVSLTGKNQYVLVTDPEMTATVAQVMMKHKSVTIKTAGDYRRSIVQDLFNNMLGERYEELARKSDPPYIQGNAGVSGLINGMDAYNVIVVAKPGELEKGVKAVWRETERIKRFGFTQTELERAKHNFQSNLEVAYKERNKSRSESYVDEYLENFLTGTAAPGMLKEYELAKEDLPSIALADVNSIAQAYISEINRDIIVKAPEKDKQQLPDEIRFLSWMKSVDQENLSPYIDDVLLKPLLSHLAVSGKVVQQKKLSSINATQLVLSNGIKVILKPTQFKANEIRFTAFAPGGTSLYNDTDYESAVNATGIISSGGIGAFSMNQLQKVLTGKQVNVSPYIGELNQGIYGSTTNKDIETELKLVYLYFTQPRKDAQVFKSEIARSKAELNDREDDPNSIYSDTVDAVIGNYNSRKTGPSLKKLDEIRLQRCLEIYKERFADASNFTFTFVGSFDIEKIKPLLSKYLGALPSTYRHEQARDLNIIPPAGKLSKTVYKGKEAKASVTLLLTGKYDYNVDNNKIVQALAEVLEIRLLERLREEEGGVYAPSCNASYVKYPTPRCGLSISFGCSPQNVEKLIASALDELRKLREEGPVEVNVAKFKAENRRGMETLLKSNGFWLSYINNQSQNKEDLNDINNYEKMLNAVTVENVKLAAKKYFNGDNLMRFVLMPEQ